jgi:hypothetical protein
MNLIYRTRIAQMHSHVDQENLLAKIEKWQTEQSDDKFLFRPYVDVNSSFSEESDEIVMSSAGKEGLLIVHQTTWQQRLLCKYGSVCLLDATYKTTRYAVPLFFLCVHTNVDYIVVATFITHFEDSHSIQEALEVIMSWNSNWNVESFMVDFCEAEINAIERTFSGE